MSADRAAPAVLLVDDSSVVRAVLAEVARAVGLRPVEADSAEAAMRLLDDGLLVDLVVLDVQLGGVDGVRAARELRRTHAELPVLVTSALDERDLRSIVGDAEVAVVPKSDLDGTVLLAHLGGGAGTTPGRGRTP